MKPTCIALIIVLAAAAHARGQTSIDPVDKLAWQENTGWTNWHDAGATPGAQGVVVHLAQGFLSGYAWSENVGFISLGRGVGPYANSSGANTGVNLDPQTGELSGFAWAENVGWINFAGGELASPPRPARYDFAQRRLRGFAWGENVGWLNLDVAESGKFVALRCPADFNADGQADFFDYLDFAQAFDAEDPSADFNGDSQVDFFDYLDFVQAFDAGC
jgi:hypothetical protein